MISAMASIIHGVLIVYSTVCSGSGHRKHRSSASLAFLREFIGRMLPFDDAIMEIWWFFKGWYWAGRVSVIVMGLELWQCDPPDIQIKPLRFVSTVDFTMAFCQFGMEVSSLTTLSYYQSVYEKWMYVDECASWQWVWTPQFPRAAIFV